jgi:hypothetical protein
VDPESYHPVGFYRDYLPNTVLESRNGNVLVENPRRSDLRQYDERDNLHLNFQRSVERVLEESPRELVPVYGIVYANTQTYAGESVPLLFLKYSAAFPYSGLPAGNGWWKRAGARLLGDPWARHELDTHGPFTSFCTERPNNHSASCWPSTTTSGPTLIINAYNIDPVRVSWHRRELDPRAGSWYQSLVVPPAFGSLPHWPSLERSPPPTQNRVHGAYQGLFR